MGMFSSWEDAQRFYFGDTSNTTTSSTTSYASSSRSPNENKAYDVKRNDIERGLGGISFLIVDANLSDIEPGIAVTGPTVNLSQLAGPNLLPFLILLLLGFFLLQRNG